MEETAWQNAVLSLLIFTILSAEVYITQQFSNCRLLLKALNQTAKFETFLYDPLLRKSTHISSAALAVVAETWNKK